MNYDKYRSKAYSKIKKYGSSIKIIHKDGEPVYNPDTDEWVQNEIETEGYALQSDFSFKDKDGTVIQQYDIMLMCAFDKPVNIYVGDSVLFNNTERVIININKLQPDGKTDIYYDLQVR